MRTIIVGRYLTFIFVLVCLIAVQIACGLPMNVGGDSSSQSEPQQPNEGGDTQDQMDMPAKEDSNVPAGDQSEGPVEPEFDSENLPCPQKGAML